LGGSVGGAAGVGHVLVGTGRESLLAADVGVDRHQGRVQLPEAGLHGVDVRRNRSLAGADPVPFPAGIIAPLATGGGSADDADEHRQPDEGTGKPSSHGASSPAGVV
jgi:hypothetical protein